MSCVGTPSLAQKVQVTFAPEFQKRVTRALDALQVEGDGVIGLIDWGDCCRTWLVAEPAIALCYAMMLERNSPLDAAAALLVS